MAKKLSLTTPNLVLKYPSSLYHLDPNFVSDYGTGTDNAFHITKTILSRKMAPLSLMLKSVRFSGHIFGMKLKWSLGPFINLYREKNIIWDKILELEQSFQSIQGKITLNIEIYSVPKKILS